MSTEPLDDDDLKADVFGRFLEELETTSDPAGLVRHFSAEHPQWACDFAEEAALTRLLVTSRDGIDFPDLERLPDFRIVRLVATGGMGIVYEAEQISLGRRVALKVRHGRPSPGRQRRFQHEQQALARLHQSHIVPIHVSGESGGWQYFAMAYIEGASLHLLVKAALDHVANSAAPLPSLSELVARLRARTADAASGGSVTHWTAGAGGIARKKVAGLDPAESARPLALPHDYFRSVAQLIADAAEALSFAHGAGVVHRDIKPSNIMVDGKGHCWLIDFGLAYYVQRDAVQSDESAMQIGTNGQTVGPMGTPEYMAPEQHESVPEGTPADPRSDVWGLGATLYELLALRRPFGGQTYPDIKRRVLSEDPPPLEALVHTVPADLAAICRKALCKIPAGRYQRADEMAADLRRWLNGEPTTARPARLARSVWMWALRNRGWAAALAAVLCGCAAAALFLMVHMQAETRQAEFRASAAEERQREEVRKAQLQRRESLMTEVQRLQLLHSNNGWSDQAWDLVRQASEIQRDDRLRDLAADTLLGLDARLVKRFAIPGSSVAFAENGKRLLIGGVDGTADTPASNARIWVRDGDRQVLSTLAGKGPVAFDAASNALQLVLTQQHTTLVLWDIARGKAVREFALTKTEPASDTIKPVIALSPAAHHVAASVGKRTMVWDVASGNVAAEFAHRSDVIAFSAHTDRMAMVDAGGQRVLVWSLSDKKTIAELPTTTVSTTSLAFGRTPRRRLDQAEDQRNEHVAIGDAGGTITIWDLQARLPVAFCRGSIRDIFTLAFSPDGTLLASAGREEARLWDVASGRTALRIRDPRGMDYLTGVAFAPDGRQLAISSRGVFFAPGVTVWDLLPGRGQHRLRGLSGQIEAIAISADGRRLAALAHNWEIGLWDLDTGYLRAIFEAPPGAYADNTGLAFSPDGQQLAYSVSTRHAGEARLWSTETCLEIKRWKLPPGLQNKFIFGPGGQLWHFQVEVQNGAALPDSSLPWRTHPRVGRLRNLQAANAEHVLAEIRDFPRHVFRVVAAPDGQHLIMEGRGDQRKEGRWVKMIELATGKVVWSHDVERNSVSARIILEPSGKAFYFTPTEAEPAFRVSVPTGQPCGALPNMPDAASDGGDYLCTIHEGGKLDCYLRQDDQVRSAVRISPSTDIVAVTFDRTKARLAWGGRDGSVVICDLPAIRDRLAQLDLGW